MQVHKYGEPSFALLDIAHKFGFNWPVVGIDGKAKGDLVQHTHLQAGDRLLFRLGQIRRKSNGTAFKHA